MVRRAQQPLRSGRPRRQGVLRLRLGRPRPPAPQPPSPGLRSRSTCA